MDNASTNSVPYITARLSCLFMIDTLCKTHRKVIQCHIHIHSNILARLEYTWGNTLLLYWFLFAPHPFKALRTFHMEMGNSALDNVWRTQGIHTHVTTCDVPSSTTVREALRTPHSHISYIHIPTLNVASAFSSVRYSHYLAVLSNSRHSAQGMSSLTSCA